MDRSSTKARSTRAILAGITLPMVQQVLAQKSLLEFIKLCRPDYLANWFHVEICTKLERFYQQLIARQSPRLMVLAPPRSGKSEIVSRYFPAWLFGNNPRLSIIAASYSYDLARLNNRDVQRIIDHPIYESLFPQTKIGGKNVRTDTRENWLRNTDIFEIVKHKGSYRSAGVGSGIGGLGADALLIDDPLKDAADAMSEKIRDGLHSWYTSTAYTRLASGGGIVLIQTRWHLKDLAGRLLTAMESGEGDKWDVVCFPAIAEEDEPHRKAGEALHPERYPLEELLKIKQAIGSRYWQALYQQHPTPGGAGLFQRHWFEIVDVVPADCTAVRYWDRAATEQSAKSSDPDWTVGLKLLRDQTGIFYVADICRLRGSPKDVDAAIRFTASQDGVSCKVKFEMEGGSSGKESAEATIRMMAGYVIEADRITGSKTLRAEPVSAQAEAGNVKLLRGTWNEAFLSELETFPLGAHDDQVDALSGAFNMLVNLNPEVALASSKSAPSIFGRLNVRGIR